MIKLTAKDRATLTTPRALRHLALAADCDERTIRAAILGNRTPHPATLRAIEAAIPVVLAKLASESTPDVSSPPQPRRRRRTTK